MKQLPKTPNRAAELIVEAEQIAARVVQGNPHVVGILLTGGLARGFADEFSDVDLEVFYPRAQRTTLVPNDPVVNQFLPQGNFVEFGKRCLEEWMSPQDEGDIWTMANRWDKSHTRILHDPQGLVAKMLKTKVVFRGGEMKRLRSEARDNSQWLAKGVADSWVGRGDLAAAHHAVNCGIDLLLDYLFLKNGQFIPHAKWKLFYARQLDVLPSEFGPRIEEALLVRELSEADLRRRQANFVPLVKESQGLPNRRD